MSTGKYTENLNGWENGKESESCFLAGNYFYKVFSRYPGLLVNPLKLSIRRKGYYNIHMKETNINTEMPGLVRLVIQTPKSHHSNLLILDYANGKAYRFEPLGKNAPYFEKINEIVENYLSIFFDMELEVIDINLDEVLDEKNPSCIHSGFCVAYIILYAYAFLNEMSYDPRNIRRFAKKVEDTYGSIPYNEVEVEYGLLTGDGKVQGSHVAAGAGIGALGGLVLTGGMGGLLGGALIGSGVGALV